MSTDLSPGVVVAGRYRLDRLLGRGGMGQVWAVTHEVTHRVAALKLLNGPSHLQEGRRRRFLREARAASAVNHPNVVRVHDFFELPDGTPVMIMDLLEGETLGQALSREGARSPEVAAAILLPVVSAVGTAHARGVIHRDLKPENVFLCGAADGSFDVRVLDFGVAKLVGAAASSAEESDALTGSGGVVGTPSYMSPEQGFGEGTVDHRSDIWSLGVLLYEVLTGSRPVDGANVGQVLKRLMNEAITPIRVLVPELPEDLAVLVDRMLCRDKAGRPNDLREVAAVLGRHTQVTVPAFGAAIEEAAPPLDSSPLSWRSSPQAVVHVDVASDPRAATDLVEATLVATSPGRDTGTEQTPAPRRRGTALVLAALIAAGAAAAVWSLRSSRVASAADPASVTPPASVEASPRAVAPSLAAPSSAPPPDASVAAGTPSLTQAERTGAAGQGRATPTTTARGRPASRAVGRPKAAAPAPSGRRGGLVDEPPF